MTEKDNYFKLVAVIVDVALFVIWEYIKEKILGPDSFETFLNKEKHKLVHIYETSCCCECMTEKIVGQRLIIKKQLLILYNEGKGKHEHLPKTSVRGRSSQICICKYSAKSHIDFKVVDITLANHIIQKCGKHELGIDNWMAQIVYMRNEIFHLSDIQECTDDKFRRKWEILEGSIMGIAKEIGKTCAIEAGEKIMQTKKLVLIDDYILMMLKYEIFCRDYWRKKCAEFERAQNQVITEKAAALHHTMPQHFTRSMESDCQQTTKKIEDLNTMVDKIDILINIFGSEENVEMLDATKRVTEGCQSFNSDVSDNKRILVPVFMQLDIPTSWDKTKVFDAIDEFRLTGTPDMNIRIKAISIDDLNIYADVAKMVLRNVDALRSEINKMMSTMLSEAEIDTKEHAKVHVNLEVLNKSEEWSGMNNKDEEKKVDNLPVIHDDQTRTTTELDERSEINNKDREEQKENLPVIHNDLLKTTTELD
ncbi:Hypothetical predicted protein, partial [Mytilus galloprovincialis]